MQVCLTLSLPRAPHMPFRSKKKRQIIKAMVRVKTPLSDLRVPFEVKFELCFDLQKKIIKTPSMLHCWVVMPGCLKPFHFSTAQGDMVDT